VTGLRPSSCTSAAGGSLAPIPAPPVHAFPGAAGFTHSGAAGPRIPGAAGLTFFRRSRFTFTISLVDDSVRSTAGVDWEAKLVADDEGFAWPIGTRDFVLDPNAGGAR
jgi:hypothetical protein